MYPEIHYQIEESRQSGGARTATVFGCYGVKSGDLSSGTDSWCSSDEDRGLWLCKDR